MKCPDCQFENPDVQKFCGKCGSKLEKVCQKCGYNNPPQYRFCGDCGHDLKESKEIVPVYYSAPQSYTPKLLTEKILTTRSSIEGERKLVTVFFADVANYTAISEKLDPEEVHQIMDGAFKILMDEIHKFEGTINQFTGDGVMALFGAPLAHEDHARRACHAALSIQKAIRGYGVIISREYGVDFKMRIGLNSGLVVVGSIGDDLRMDYTAVGDTTNLAARMESMARPDTVLISGNTHRLVRDFFEFKSLGEEAVKGKEKPQEAFELIKTGAAETRIDASVARGLTGFVGRADPMATLKEAFDRVQSGAGQVLSVVGEAGVGKSRLLLEFKNLLLPQHVFTYLEGRCIHYGDSMAYLPILDTLRSYFEIKEGDGASVVTKKITDKVSKLDEDLKHNIPPLRELFSLEVDDEDFMNLEPQVKREQTFEAVRDIFIGESQNRALILAVDDLQWIDKTSEEFLNYLIGWLANTPILLILLYRPEYTHHWGSKSYYTKIGLDRLSTNSSTEIVEAILYDGEAVPELRDFILNRAAGNPLFIEEFTYSLLESGSIRKKDNQYVLSGKASEIQVPDTIQGLIAARMDRLEDNIKRTMQVASVIGREFAFRILQTITGMLKELKTYLFNLQGLEFIYEKSLFPELKYIFKHALTQEVAYESLLIKTRTEIHEKIGNAIEALYPQRLEEFYDMLAYHYSKSQHLEKAYQYLKLSGEKAARNYSNLEAFHFFKDAINVLNRMPETKEIKGAQIEIRLLMYIPMFFLDFTEDSLQILLEGERLAKELGDEKSLATFYSRLGHYYTTKGKDPLLGFKYLEQCFKEARKIQDIELIAPVALSLCNSFHESGEYSKIVDLAPNVLALLEKNELCDGVYSELCVQYGSSLGIMGNFEEGKIFCEKGLRIAIEIGDLMDMGFSEMIYGLFYALKGEGTLALEHFQNSIHYTEEADWPFMSGVAWSGLGFSYYLIGDPGTARKYIEKGLKIQMESPAEYVLSLHYWFLGMVYCDSGDFKKAQKYTEKVLKLSQKNNEKHLEGFSRISLGRILGKADITQKDKAEESILEGIKILEALKLRPSLSWGYLFLGELYAHLGRKEKALENLKKAEGKFKEMGMDYWLARTQGVLGGL